MHCFLPDYTSVDRQISVDSMLRRKDISVLPMGFFVEMWCTVTTNLYQALK